MFLPRAEFFSLLARFLTIISFPARSVPTTPKLPQAGLTLYWWNICRLHRHLHIPREMVECHQGYKQIFLRVGPCFCKQICLG